MRVKTELSSTSLPSPLTEIPDFKFGSGLGSKQFLDITGNINLFLIGLQVKICTFVYTCMLHQQSLAGFGIQADR